MCASSECVFAPLSRPPAASSETVVRAPCTSSDASVARQVPRSLCSSLHAGADHLPPAMVRCQAQRASQESASAPHFSRNRGTSASRNDLSS